MTRTVETVPGIRVDVPEGSSGAWRVERFTVSEQASHASLLYAINHRAERGRSIPAGTYTRLMRGQKVVMSDTPAEIADHWPMGVRAKGSVLILGLGLGVVAQMCLDKTNHSFYPDFDGVPMDSISPAVDHVTVVERDPDVIALVAPHYLGRYPDRVTIIQADALDWRPPKGTHYQAVWCDIWDDLCTDNLPQMALLRRRYARRADWVGCWGQHLLVRERRREVAERRRWGGY